MAVTESIVMNRAPRLLATVVLAQALARIAEELEALNMELRRLEAER